MLLLYHRDFSEVIKIWVDAGEIKTYDLDYNDRKFAKIMQEVPNFDKSEGAKKVFERKEYIILQVKKGYIIYNQNKSFDKGHTHIRSYNIAKTIIDNCIKGKRPKTKNTYLLESHIRISNNEKYINLLKELKENNKTKDKYINKK